MVVAPFDDRALNRLDGAVTAAAKRAIGLSPTVSTPMVVLPHAEFGVDIVGTVRSMYAEVVLEEWVSTALTGTDRPARTTRALLTMHRAGRSGGAWAAVPDTVSRR